MITRQELTQSLAELLQPENFSDYCDNGLQVEGAEQIKQIGTAVTASEATIDLAIEKGVDALIVHHGLFWDRPRVKLTGGMQRRVAKLLAHKINLYGYHLPLDAHPEVGNNWCAARDLGLAELEPFCGYGVIGSMSPIGTSEWVGRLEDYYCTSSHVALGGPDKVERVAILSGGGHRYLPQAIEAGADCYITGSFDEPQWHLAHEEGIHFIALGHSATERIGPRKLAQHLGGVFLDLNNPF